MYAQPAVTFGLPRHEEEVNDVLSGRDRIGARMESTRKKAEIGRGIYGSSSGTAGGCGKDVAAIASTSMNIDLVLV